MNTQPSLSRRETLVGGGALIVAFSLLPGAPSFAQGAVGSKPLALTEVDSYLSIDADGIATVYSGKVDLGTGIRTALTQIAADELDLPMQSVSIVQGDTALTPNQGTTYGSFSIQNGGVQIRQAAAAARRALVEEAAVMLHAKLEELRVANGVIMAPNGESLTYGALIGGKSFSITLDPKNPVPTKDPKDFALVGKPVQRLDIPDKVTGRFTYMQDFRLPGMLHGRVVRPPAIGATLESVNEDSVKDIPGLLKIVREGNFLGVVATNEWAAIKASHALEARWSNWEGLPDQAKLFDHVRATKIAVEEVTGHVGDADAALAQAGNRSVTSTYDFAIHTHGSIGPSCAVAEFRDGKLTCWSASQATHNLVKQLAKMFTLPVEDVHCVYIEGSGCYGRNGHEDAAADAALLAKAVGKPVRVQWSRADEHGWDPKGPPTLIDLRAAIDSAGDVTAWESQFFIPQQIPVKPLGVVPLIAAALAKSPFDDQIAPGSIFQNSNIPYKFANIKTTCHRLETTPFRPSWIRSPGRMQNTYANECFIDELAARAKVDPIAFRLKYLDSADARGIETLNRVAALARWDPRASPKNERSGDILAGRGVAYCKYELVRTYVAAVAEVEVNAATGAIRVRKFFVAHDCGQIINPDGLKNQIDGNIIQTVSRTLKEEVKFDRSMVTSLDWKSYPILTFPEIPEIAYDLIDRPNEPPWGAGEPAAAVVPSAISNAIFDATGVRLRSIPYTPDKVKAALGA
jgi:CO/xanthine dehydrogenase Mo-binding subunit